MSRLGANVAPFLSVALGGGARVLGPGADASRASESPASPSVQSAPGGVAVGPLEIDVRARRVALAGAPLVLRPREFALLSCLASEPGRVFTKRELVRLCWGGHEPPARSR